MNSAKCFTSGSVDSNNRFAYNQAVYRSAAQNKTSDDKDRLICDFIKNTSECALQGKSCFEESREQTQIISRWKTSLSSEWTDILKMLKSLPCVEKIGVLSEKPHFDLNIAMTDDPQSFDTISDMIIKYKLDHHVFVSYACFTSAQYDVLQEKYYFEV